MRVSMSAMGSLTIPAGAFFGVFVCGLPLVVFATAVAITSPARLRHAGDPSLGGIGSEANAAHSEFAQVRARTPAEAAAIVESHLELGRSGVPLPALNRSFLGQTLSYLFLNGIPTRVRSLRASSSKRAVIPLLTVSLRTLSSLS